MLYEQERVITRIQQAVMREPTIHTCFLSGSFGRRTSDDYSDLDVALVFDTAAARDAAYGRRREFAESIMTYLPAKGFDADHVRPNFYVVLYSNGTKADFRYETADELQPNHWDRDIRILKDSSGWGAEFAAASQRSPIPPPALISVNQLEELDNRFWVMFWDTFRQVQRGDYDKPFRVYLEMTSFTLPTFFYLLPEDEPAYQNLINVFFNKDTKQTLNHLRQLLDAYVAARTAVVRRHRLTFAPNSSFEQSILKLVNK